MQKVIDEYFKICDEKGEPYTITWLSLSLDLDRKSIINYSKDSEFFHNIKKAKSKVEKKIKKSY